RLPSTCTTRRDRAEEKGRSAASCLVSKESCCRSNRPSRPVGKREEHSLPSGGLETDSSPALRGTPCHQGQDTRRTATSFADRESRPWTACRLYWYQAWPESRETLEQLPVPPVPIHRTTC